MKKAIFSCKDRNGDTKTITIEYSSKRELVNKRIKLSLDYPVMNPVIK